MFWTTDNGAWQDVYPDAGWFYFTENEVTPGAVRVGHYKANNSQQTG